MRWAVVPTPLYHSAKHTKIGRGGPAWIWATSPRFPSILKMDTSPPTSGSGCARSFSAGTPPATGKGRARSPPNASGAGKLTVMGHGPDLSPEVETRYITPECCLACVTLAAGRSTRPPLSFIHASQSSPSSPRPGTLDVGLLCILVFRFRRQNIGLEDRFDERVFL